MLRYLVVAVLAAFAAQFSSAARASTIQYDLTLTPTVGSIGGTGYFDVNSPLTGTGANALTDFSVTIDNQVFSLGNELSSATATFSNGALTSLNYIGDLVSGTWKTGLNLDILGTGGLSYTFLDLGSDLALSSGTISAVDPPSTTPLPSTVVLFATGLLGLLLLNYRRKKLA
jgi:hypothetical protein